MALSVAERDPPLFEGTRRSRLRLLPGFGPEQLSALGVTRRELEVIELVAEGLTNEQAARAMGCSPLTVKKHLERLFEKLAAPNRAALVASVWYRAAPRGS